MEDAKSALVQHYAQRARPGNMTVSYWMESPAPIGVESCYKQVFGMSDRHRQLHRLLT